MVRAKIEQNPIVRVVVHTALYAMKILAVWILLRGHQEPGGGFIAGLMVAVAIALQGVAFGSQAANAIMPIPVQYLLGSGLLIAFVTVLGPTLFGDALMKHVSGQIHLPLLGDLEVGTAMLFDLGVFLVVVGTMKVVLLSIATEKPKRAQSEPRGLDEVH